MVGVELDGDLVGGVVDAGELHDALAAGPPLDVGAEVVATHELELPLRQLVQRVLQQIHRRPDVPPPAPLTARRRHTCAMGPRAALKRTSAAADLRVAHAGRPEVGTTPGVACMRRAWDHITATPSMRASMYGAMVDSSLLASQIWAHGGMLRRPGGLRMWGGGVVAHACFGQDAQHGAASECDRARVAVLTCALRRTSPRRHLGVSVTPSIAGCTHRDKQGSG